MELRSEEILRLHVELEPAVVVGQTPQGSLAIIPIVGGSFEGPGLKGRVCRGGADWNRRLDSGQASVFASYWLETDDGEYIAIQNSGVIDFAAESKIKTTPSFAASLEGRYAHLNHGVYLGELEGGADGKSVDITIYRAE